MDALSCAVPRISVAFALFILATTIGTSTMIEIEDGNEEVRLQYNEYREQSGSRRLLIGPGSSPPTCRARCGRCFPCRPVHVAIQPGRSIPMEYYPEAWRCKCGNKLFMP